MSEKIQEQISAFVDGELPANEAELLVHRLSRDKAIHGKALNYCMIGSAMRDELLQPDPDQLRRAVLQGIGGEPQADAPLNPSPWDYRRLVRPAVGLAVAASVAMVAILGLQSIVQQGGDLDGALVTDVSEVAVPSYIVPREPVDAGLVRVPVRLTNYLVNHGEYASGLRRAAIHSEIVGSQSNADTDEDTDVSESP